MQDRLLAWLQKPWELAEDYILELYCHGQINQKALDNWTTVHYWHIASKLTIVSKFYQIVRVEKCALNTDSTIPTQSIILSDHVVGKMFI